MWKKTTIFCIILMNLSNTDAFLTDLFNFVNPLNIAPSTELRGFGDEHLEDQHSHYDTDFQMHEIQDNFTLQKAIGLLLVRLKAAKRFIQNWSEFLKYTEENHWEVNTGIVSAKRYDLKKAKNDVDIIEDALENPSQFEDMIWEQDLN